MYKNTEERRYLELAGDHGRARLVVLAGEILQRDSPVMPGQEHASHLERADPRLGDASLDACGVVAGDCVVVSFVFSRFQTKKISFSRPSLVAFSLAACAAVGATSSFSARQLGRSLPVARCEISHRAGSQSFPSKNFCACSLCSFRSKKLATVVLSGSLVRFSSEDHR